MYNYDIIHKNIFDLYNDVECLVNPTNCVGVMGKGLALQFKRKFPDNFNEYESKCKQNQLSVGDVLLVKNKDDDKFIMNACTKQHWRDKSSYSDVYKCVDNIIKLCNEYNISSIAIPKLGCGLGGLKWDDVKNYLIGQIVQEENSKTFYNIVE